MAAPAPQAAANTSVVVRHVDPFGDERWDRYLAEHRDALVYHHSRWLRALHAESRGDLLCLALEDERHAFRGVLPLMATRGLPLSAGGPAAERRLSSLPRTPIAGPLADDAAGLRALLEVAVQSVPNGTRLQLKLPDTRLDGLTDAVTAQPWRSTYLVPLPERPEDLRFGDRRNHAAIRRAVSSAGRAGLAARQAETLDEVRQWYRLYLETMRHHLVAARPFRFFRALWEELRPIGLMRLLLAEREGELLAGLVVLRFGSTTTYAFHGAARSAFDLRPNDLLHWEAIHVATAEQHRWYDLGEVVEHQEGLARYKRKWGAELHPLYRYHWPALEGPLDAGGTVDGTSERLLSRAWRRVPLGITAFAGDVINRRL